MERESLEPLLRSALNMLLTRDAALIAGDNSEWAVAHRLAVYLEAFLPGWDIDCEYNRQGEERTPKTLAAGLRVRPDIIVHRRGRTEREHNLLAIELKKSNSGPDLEKAREYTRPPAGSRKYQYRHGLTIALYDGSSMKWFENGKFVS